MPEEDGKLTLVAAAVVNSETMEVSLMISSTVPAEDGCALHG